MQLSFHSQPHRTLKRGVFQAVLVGVIMYSALGFYLVVLRWRGAAATFTTASALDDLLPFWPSWVWVYLLPYLVAPPLIGFLLPPTFWWYIHRGLVVIGLTLMIFVIYPTQIDGTRRGTFAGSGLTAMLYLKMIEIDDPPANAAPSLHVSLTLLLALAFWRDFPRWWPIWIGLACLVWVSTLVTRQHHLLDVLSGVLLAYAVTVVFAVLTPRAQPDIGSV
jgi:membrane-associated phospholipid phosphatase